MTAEAPARGTGGDGPVAVRDSLARLERTLRHCASRRRGRIRAERLLSAAVDTLEATNHSPGLRAHSPELRAHSPGLRAHSPGLRAHSPGLRAHSPGLRAHSPGAEESLEAGTAPARRALFRTFGAAQCAVGAAAARVASRVSAVERRVKVLSAAAAQSATAVRERVDAPQQCAVLDAAGAAVLDLIAQLACAEESQEGEKNQGVEENQEGAKNQRGEESQENEEIQEGEKNQEVEENQEGASNQRGKGSQENEGGQEGEENLENEEIQEGEKNQDDEDQENEEGNLACVVGLRRAWCEAEAFGAAAIRDAAEVHSSPAQTTCALLRTSLLETLSSQRWFPTRRVREVRGEVQSIWRCKVREAVARRQAAQQEKWERHRRSVNEATAGEWA